MTSDNAETDRSAEPIGYAPSSAESVEDYADPDYIVLVNRPRPRDVVVAQIAGGVMLVAPLGFVLLGTRISPGEAISNLFALAFYGLLLALFALGPMHRHVIRIDRAGRRLIETHRLFVPLSSEAWELGDFERLVVQPTAGTVRIEGRWGLTIAWGRSAAEAAAIARAISSAIGLPIVERAA